MNSYKKLFFLILSAGLLAASGMNAKVKQKSLYMFGVAFSFTDSTVYTTDISYVDSVTVDTKTHFLMDRNLYAIQMEEHVAQTYGIQNVITAVYYDTKKKDLTKKLLSVKKKQGKNKGWHLHDTELAFHSELWIAPEILTISEGSDEAAGGKKSKKSKSKKSKSKK